MNLLEALTAGFDGSVDDEGDRAHTENTESAGEENSQENPDKDFSEIKKLPITRFLIASERKCQKSQLVFYIFNFRTGSLRN